MNREGKKAFIGRNNLPTKQQLPVPLTTVYKKEKPF
jgi:hypothetical protein